MVTGSTIIRGGTTTAGVRAIRAREFLMFSHPSTILKQSQIRKASQDLMEFIQDIIYQKGTGWGHL